MESPCAAGIQACLGGVRQKIGLSKAAGGSGAITEAEFRLRMDFLGKVPLFKRLPRDYCPVLAKELRGCRWELGDVLLEKGEALKEFTIVAAGCAEIHLDGVSHVQKLNPGDYFGEKVLQTGKGFLRSPAMVVAGEGLATLSMTADEFERFGLRSHLSFPKRRALSRFAKGGQVASSACDKTEGQKRFITEALRANVNLRSLINMSDAAVKQLCDAAERKEVKSGTQVVQRGEYGGMFYIVESGTFELRHDDAANAPGDGLSRAVSQANAKAMGAGRAPSEMQRRKQRKEVFFQALVHGDECYLEQMPGGTSSRSLGRSTTGGITPAESVSNNKILRFAVASSRRSFEMGTPCNSPYLDENDVIVGGSPSAWRNNFGRSPSAGRSPGFGMKSPAKKGDRFCFGDDRVSTPGGSEEDSLPCLLSNRSTNEDLFRTSSTPNLGEEVATAPSFLGFQTCRSNDSLETSQDDNLLGVRKRGESFGEMALLFRAPRTSTAIAAEDSVVWCVSQKQFQRILRGTQHERETRIARQLGQVDILHGLLSLEKEELAHHFLTSTFKKGDWLVHEGEAQQEWFIILKGECIMTRHVEGKGENEEEELAKLQPFEHFGERALLKDRCSEFSVRASSDELQCLVLAKPHFLELADVLSAEDYRNAAGEELVVLFGKHKADRLKASSDTDLSKLEKRSMRRRSPRAGFAHSQSSEFRFDRSAGKPKLKRTGILGQGAFGLVSLEEDPRSGKQYALKTLNRVHVVKNSLIEAVRYERDILSMIESSFIITLHGTFQDSTFIYFLFEPMLGGELWQHMCREPRTFRNPEVHKFVLGCLTCALEHLHERHVIYRDLKPENVLFDTAGYVKLCDMGFAKFLIGKTSTLCGTPEYMAPEVLLPGGYDRMVDWWALGILAYEFMAAITPFADEDGISGPEIIFANILAAKGRPIEMPPRLGLPTVAFIRGLLEFEPEKRLGRVGAGQLKKHAFFGTIDFKALNERRLTPGFIPKVKTQAEWARTLKRERGTDVPCEETAREVAGMDFEF